MKSIDPRLITLLTCIIVCVTLLGEPCRLSAQGTTGTILGTVVDTSGAAVPDATIQVKNNATGFVQTVSSDGQGLYRVPDLQVGDYEVRASKAGFSTAVRTNETLIVG